MLAGCASLSWCLRRSSRWLVGGLCPALGGGGGGGAALGGGVVGLHAGWLCPTLVVSLISLLAGCTSLSWWCRGSLVGLQSVDCALRLVVVSSVSMLAGCGEQEGRGG